MTKLSIKQFLAVSTSAGTMTAFFMWGLFLNSENENTIRELQASIQEEIKKSYAAQETFELILENPTLAYIVHEGDTVTSISERFYGTPNPPNVFIQANELNIDLFPQVGEVLKMPDVPGISVINQVIKISAEGSPSSKIKE